MAASYHILLPLPFNHGFDYFLPAGLNDVSTANTQIVEQTAIKKGTFVRVPFGKKEVMGVVWGGGKGDVAPEKIKSILAILPIPALQEHFCEFIEWVANYTLSPLGSVLKMVLLKDSAFDVQDSGKKKPKKEIEFSQAISLNSAPPLLSASQQEAANTLAAKLGKGFSATLIDGVTGSGKTEVYFDALEKVMASGGQALVLLPEIALSVQWLSRFEKRFGFMPHLWHSGVTPAKRRQAYKAIREQKPCVLIGARSALFLPFATLSLIIIDEEHEHSYKQEEGVIYHARDMAVARAYHEKIPCILVSATPSLETLTNVEVGKYSALHLPERHNDAQFPSTHILDMRKEKLPANQFISEPLRHALAETCARGHQSLLFLNRRGFAPLLLCRACGHRIACPDCSSWMALHKRRAREDVAPRPSPLAPTLQCHQCGHTTPAPVLCPACGAEDALYAYGPGVERLAEEVSAFLPSARVALVSSDHIQLPEHTPATRNMQLATLIEAIEQRTIDIIIGTQILAKGHHFPGLALVGVVDADASLQGSDLRAGEKTYQLLHQLSGRAGRAHVAGHVIMQSYMPEHPVLQALSAGDRETFIALEKQWRAAAHMPPYGKLAALIIDGPNEQEVKSYAQKLASLWHTLFPLTHDGENNGKDSMLLGPTPAPLVRLRGRYRFRLLVRTSRGVPLQEQLRTWLATAPAPRPIRVRVDIDPVSFM